MLFSKSESQYENTSEILLRSAGLRGRPEAEVGSPAVSDGILAAIRVDFLFVATTSSCGTVRRCGEYIWDYGLATRVVAVDAMGSLIFSNVKASRMIPAWVASPGAGSWSCARPFWLAARPALVAAIDRIPDGAVCVAILPAAESATWRLSSQTSGCLSGARRVETP